jgi:hypothetical protein
MLLPANLHHSYGPNRQISRLWSTSPSLGHRTCPSLGVQKLLQDFAGRELTAQTHGAFPVDGEQLGG